MKNLVIIFLLFPGLCFSQVQIGKTNGASIMLENEYFEVIFKTPNEKYASFYILNTPGEDNGLSKMKRYVYQLFENKKGDYLLQFEADSVLLVYEKGSVILEIWRNHKSDNRIRSQGSTLEQFQELFGDLKYVQKKL